jgi:hypothetical protein
MAAQLEALRDVAGQGEGEGTGRFEEKQTSESWTRFAHTLMDGDIASVLNGLALYAPTAFPQRVFVTM